MSLVAEQWYKGHSVTQADWWLGGEILAPGVRERGVKGLRTFTEQTAYENDPQIGTDPQPKHYRNKYTGPADYGGVHINSGVPNHAFYRVALELGGNSWDRAGKIWYETLKSLSPYSQFQDAAAKSHSIAGSCSALEAGNSRRCRVDGRRSASRSSVQGSKRVRHEGYRRTNG